MPSSVTPFRIAIVGIAFASACIAGCSTVPGNQVAAVSGGVPCPVYNSAQGSGLNGNVGGAIGGRKVLGPTPAFNQPLCYTP